MSDITIYVTSDLTSSERKISYLWTVQHLKHRLEMITGIAPQFQTIHVYKSPNSNEYDIIADSNHYSTTDDSNKLVSSLALLPYCRLHIIDENPLSELGEFLPENHENIDEFKLSEEEYQNKSNTVLAWKVKNQLGRFDPQFQSEKSSRVKLDEQAVKAMEVGNRCRIINIEGERRGTIRFLGKITELDDGDSDWVGIEFDEPVGKNDGLIGQIRPFTCKPKHGSFVRPQKVEVGDYPELDPFESDEEL